MKKKGFSKKMLIADYVVAIALIVGFFVCAIINGIYAQNVYETMISAGADMSLVAMPQLFNLDGFGILLGSWIIQLGLSSGCYYSLVKVERKTQMPMILIEDLPDEIKENVDMTQLITSVLSISE